MREKNFIRIISTILVLFALQLLLPLEITGQAEESAINKETPVEKYSPSTSKSNELEEMENEQKKIESSNKSIESALSEGLIESEVLKDESVNDLKVDNKDSSNSEGLIESEVLKDESVNDLKVDNKDSSNIEEKKENPVIKEETNSILEKIDIIEDIENPYLNEENQFSKTNEVKPLLFFTENTLGPFNKRSRRSLRQLVPIELEPGEVKTKKTATKVNGMVNTWDIEVLIEGRDSKKIETTDIVLVMDNSGSMSIGTRMMDAKNAAKRFINNMTKKDSNIRIAIVSFANGSEIKTPYPYFSNNKDELETAVDSIMAGGGTHTQAGLLQGKNLLNASTAKHKHMILLSDGEPTFSYEPQNWSSKREQKRGAFLQINAGNYYIAHSNIYNFDNKYAIYDGKYNEVRVGSGRSLTSSSEIYNNLYWPINTTDGNSYYPLRSTNSGYQAVNLKYIDNGAAALQASREVKSDSVDLYTIAIAAGNNGISILKDIASPGKDYSTERSEELLEIYDYIATNINLQTAINDASVSDEMGDGFSLVSGTISSSQGSTTVVDSNDIQNQTLNWNIDGKIMQLKEGYEDVRYAKLNYRIEINPDIVRSLPSASGETEEHDLFKTNKSTILNYSDLNKEKKQKSFVSPEVDPVLLKIRKNLLDKNDNLINKDPRIFNIQIKDSGSNFKYIENLKANTDYHIVTSLRKEGTYDIEEIGITGNGNTNLKDFNIMYAINGIKTEKFNVNHLNGQPRGDIVIDITNKEIMRTIDFTFSKLDNSGNALLGSDFTLEKNNEDGITKLNKNTGIDPLFSFEKLTEGTYILKEIKAPKGYKLPTNSWEIAVIRNEVSGLLEIQIPNDSFLTSTPDETYTVKNEEESEFPKTGGAGSITYIGVGLLILIASLKIYLKTD